jgi:hypothetical protein
MKIFHSHERDEISRVYVDAMEVIFRALR